jgi:hypothetical protein
MSIIFGGGGLFSPSVVAVVIVFLVLEGGFIALTGIERVAFLISRFDGGGLLSVSAVVAAVAVVFLALRMFSKDGGFIPLAIMDRVPFLDNVVLRSWFSFPVLPALGNGVPDVAMALGINVKNEKEWNQNLTLEEGLHRDDKFKFPYVAGAALLSSCQLTESTTTN